MYTLLLHGLVSKWMTFPALVAHVVVLQQVVIIVVTHVKTMHMHNLCRCNFQFVLNSEGAPCQTGFCLLTDRQSGITGLLPCKGLSTYTTVHASWQKSIDKKHDSKYTTGLGYSLKLKDFETFLRPPNIKMVLDHVNVFEICTLTA